MMGDQYLNKPENFYNRELSWLQFNARVLSEARDRKIPLLERAKFLAITGSNLDEFFMVRVASLKDMVHAKYTKPDCAGLTPTQQLDAIMKKAHELVNHQYMIYNRSLLPKLKSEGISVLPHEDLTEEQGTYVDEYFRKKVYPVLTPMAVDSSRPFPLVQAKTLNICALLYKEGKEETYEFSTVQVPNVLPRLIKIPSQSDRLEMILLEQIIERNIDKLYLNYEVIGAFPYRIMRNADLEIDEEEAEDLLHEIEKQVKRRQWGEVIRLEIEEGADKRLLKILRKELGINERDIFRINGPLDLTFLMKMYGVEGYDHLRQEEFKPQMSCDFHQDEDIFQQIRYKDIFLHHPYESFDPVVDFVKQAAADQDVLAIKQTLYRVSGNSPIIAALARAADNGKQVTVLVELKARFDEENNIIWAKKLEKAGCHVIYGLVGLKTHSKITLVVRREEEGIRRYVHLGTGNYNDSTAKLYTDMGLFTCKEAYGEDATAVFNMLSGYSEPASWNKLSLAPLWLKNRFLALIEREIQYAKEGKEAKIIAKMNSLVDQQVIMALYRASGAGVRIDLIVRGICCLKAGIPDLSENISVRSIIGHFLEHSRVFYFYNNSREEVYCSSADWMPRNLERRVEILYPIEEQMIKDKVIAILKMQLDDNVKAHLLQPGGNYVKPDRRGKQSVNSQEFFCREAIENAKKNQDDHEMGLMSERRFVPASNPDEV